MLYRYSPLLNLNVSNFLKAYLDPYVQHKGLTANYDDIAAVTNCTGGIPWILNVGFGRDCFWAIYSLGRACFFAYQSLEMFDWKKKRF